MNPEQLRKKISYSLNEGFTEKEIRQVLRQQGGKHSQINQALNQVKSQGNDQDISTSSSKEDKESQNTQNYEEKFNQKNESFKQKDQSQSNNRKFGQEDSKQGNSQIFNSQDSAQNKEMNQNQRFQEENQDYQKNQQRPQQEQEKSISDLDLTDSAYHIRQQLFLTRYSVFNKNNKKVLKAKNKILSLKTNIPFLRPDSGKPIFRVVGARFPNISDNYQVKNEQKSDVMAVLDRKRTLLNQVWRIRDPQDNSIVATIKNENTVLQFLRTYGGIVPLIPNLFALIPHKYTVMDVNKNQIGKLEGELGIRDEYEVKLQDSGQLDHRDMISSIIAIDALEGN